MSKRTTFTTITPLPAGVSRETAMATLHDHLEMIDLNPAHTSRVQIKPPPESTPEEYHCTWYEITDKISYFPGYKGKVSFKACFHDLPYGLQTHCYAPMGLDIKEKWTLGGNEPHEPIQPVELGIGAPISGLYIREDVEMKCNFLMTRFVRKTLKDCLSTLVARLVVKTQLQEAAEKNKRLTQSTNQSYSQHSYSNQSVSSGPHSPPNSPPLSPPTMHLQPLRLSHQSGVSQFSQQQYPGSPPPSAGFPVSPPPSGTFPKHPYDPSAYGAVHHHQHPALQCPPQWSPQTSQMSYKHEQQQHQPLPQYDEKPTYSEMDSNQKARPDGAFELP
ncbi:hypothetical protein GLAREA_11359 [Glarea lozoyensis ATCC 20868]|uniref:DUF7053 domain-containing protein n=1 Tax=Glarea lozoyensis (strain ATCC 20868 / MF5171) TaxID=1116229 RepID=S3DEX1_GLAL2|nr:uncharacterized protein GLAREA_11359 [Glarea lozoyensis ATCC 20868]EPE35659.1 hypothetical protein GLAREA_11359 [Glarea lozoyensis ATCC 20868]